MDSERLANLRVEYCAGQLSILELCRKYDVRETKLREYIKKYAWVRMEPPGVDKIMREVEKVFSPDPEEHALQTAVQVVTLHRKDVARLRSIASTLVDRLGLLLEGKQPMARIEVVDEETGEVTIEERPIPTLGARESPADLLEKLSRVMVRTTQIERQAFGLKDFDPGGEESEAELAQELALLQEQLEAKASNKALERANE